MTDSPALRRWLLLPVLLLSAACTDDPADPDPDPDPDPEPSGYAFIYEPPAGVPAVTSISVRGTFNNWGSPTDLVMEEREDGSWVAYIELDSATTYSYKFVINGEWIGDMCNDATWGHDDAGGLVHLESDGCESDGFGGQNAILVLGEIGLAFTHTEGAPEYISIADDVLSVRFRARGDQIQSARVIAGTDTAEMHVQMSLGLNDVWRGTLPATLTGTYDIEVVTVDGETQSFGPYDVPTNPFRSVAWASESVAYQIFPDRFWNGDPSNDTLALGTDEFYFNELWQSNGPTVASDWYAAPNNQHCCHQYYGGDLAGIIEKMSHLSALGVDVVYLNPIWDNGSAHGYDAHDYMTLAPKFGDSTMVRTFLDAAHAAGIRVIWDFVPNHVGLGFWAFQHAVENGSSSPYYDWFNFHPDGDGLQAGDGDDYDGWWGIGSLPELQTEVPDVMAHVLEAAQHWTEFGFDGIRVDVPGDIDNRAEFFPAFRNVTKTANPDVYLVGEIWENDPSWLQGDQFDALMNYAIGRDAVQQFANDAISGDATWSRMASLYAAYPEAVTAMLFNVIATHDTDRLLTLLGGGDLGQTPSATALSRQRLASALLYALPGMPVTYYGDECAMLGSSTGSIHRGRATMRWNACPDGYGIFTHYQQLSGLKHDLAALATGTIREHLATAEVLSFLRGEPGPGEVLAAFNQSSGVQPLALPAGTWADAVSGETVNGSVQLGSYGWRYLVRQ